MNPKYAKILHLPHPEPRTHPRMSRLDRAAQFGTFAALSGYEDAVRETERLTGTKRPLDEETANRLNAELNAVIRNPGAAITVTYFQPDAKKSGGEYVTVSDFFRRLIESDRILELKNGFKIPLDDIFSIVMR